MKNRTRKIVALFLACSLFCTFALYGDASAVMIDGSMGTGIIGEKQGGYSALSAIDAPIVSEKTLFEIEQLQDEVTELKNKRRLIDFEDQIELEKIDNEISEREARIEQLGARKVDKEILGELLEVSLLQENAARGVMTPDATWDPSDLIDTFDGMYSVTCTKLSTGGNLQAHLVFEHNENDPYLHQLKSEFVYEAVPTLSQIASYYGEELLKIYAQKYVGTIISLSTVVLNPLRELIPWELAFVALPSEESLSVNHDSVHALINTVTTLKFVFVYNSTIDDWELCLSTNKVSVYATVTQALSQNGQAINDTYEESLWEYGDWYRAASIATSAYADGVARNTCINRFILHSEALGEDIISINIHAPSAVINMM